MRKTQKLSTNSIPDFVDRLHIELSDKKGQIAAVESESGEYILDKTLRKAAIKARKTYPGKVFYFIRIGYSYVHRL
ncbi:MAG: hypothetical protein IIA88_10380 [Bacteroidetes bacterium]|nr:hypothetical protein [Bacteroidota bacterium]